jgi:hypothetical protein
MGDAEKGRKSETRAAERHPARCRREHQGMRTRRQEADTNGLVSEEQGVERHGFGEGHAENADDEDFAESVGIAADGFSGFVADKTHAEGGAEAAEAALDAIGEIASEASGGSRGVTQHRDEVGGEVEDFVGHGSFDFWFLPPVHMVMVPGGKRDLKS